jgi:hypothetical protein
MPARTRPARNQRDPAEYDNKLTGGHPLATPSSRFMCPPLLSPRGVLSYIVVEDERNAHGIEEHVMVKCLLFAGGIAIPAGVAEAQPGDEGRTPGTPAGMAQMHEPLEQGNPGMVQMYRLMPEGNPDMSQMCERMHESPPITPDRSTGRRWRPTTRDRCSPGGPADSIEGVAGGS